MEIVSHPSKQTDFLLGDIYYGYLIPTVICGRSVSFQRDIKTFVTHWCDKVFDGNINKFLRNLPDFGLDSLGLEFKERMFSKILVVSPKENLSDVWQILWGVWSEIFINGPEKRTSNYVLLFRVSCVFLMFYLYFSQTGSHNLSVPLSLDTFERCMEISEDLLNRYRVTSVFNVLNYMVNHKCFTFSSYDGVQYLHQNKFGGPLKINK